MRTLKRPMFKIGGKAQAGNDGIMSGLVDREELQAGTALEKFQSIGAGEIDFSDLDSDFDTTKRITLPSGETQQVIIPQTGLSDKAKANLGIISRDDYQKTLAPKFPAGMTFPADAAAMGADTKFTPTVKDTSEKDDTEPTITTKDTGSNQVTQAEKNEILKARAKEFEELLNPGARKRVINNALAAASGAFGKSTGNTMQDIANAITAAAGATSEIDKTKQKAAELAIGESIQKGIAKEKYKPGNYEFLVALKERDPTTYKELIKNKDTDQDTIIAFARNYTGPTAVPKAIGDMYRLKADGANAKDYGGTLPVRFDKKSDSNVPDFNKMEAGKIYYNYTDQNFYKIGEGGEPEVTSKPSYLK
jgi:hypothetical protein